VDGIKNFIAIIASTGSTLDVCFCCNYRLQSVVTTET